MYSSSVGSGSSCSSGRRRGWALREPLIGPNLLFECNVCCKQSSSSSGSWKTNGAVQSGLLTLRRMCVILISSCEILCLDSLGRNLDRFQPSFVICGQRLLSTSERFSPARTLRFSSSSLRSQSANLVFSLDTHKAIVGASSIFTFHASSDRPVSSRMSAARFCDEGRFRRRLVSSRSPSRL